MSYKTYITTDDLYINNIKEILEDFWDEYQSGDKSESFEDYLWGETTELGRKFFEHAINYTDLDELFENNE